MIVSALSIAFLWVCKFGAAAYMLYVSVSFVRFMWKTRKRRNQYTRSGWVRRQVEIRQADPRCSVTRFKRENGSVIP